LSCCERRPSYQSGIATIVGSYRGTPDVSAVANVYTPVWVQDSFGGSDLWTCSPQPGPCWFLVGGTSVATPVWAGIVNAAGGFSASTNAELTKLYKDSSTYFNDITNGSCGPYMGSFATRGWDLCTGLGSPRSYRGK